MLVPGMNLLGVALGAIRGQLVGYHAWEGRAPDPKGILKDVFAARVEIPGSMQPVSRDRVQFLGLDASKSYATLYAPGVAHPVSRDRGADKFDFNGRMYAAEGKTDWTAQDGWNGVLLVDVGPVTP